MHSVAVDLAAAGNSPWIIVDWNATAFGVGLFATITSGANLTYKVQHTGDNNRRRTITISRSGTVATVTDVDHRLSVGDAVNIGNSGDANLDSQVLATVGYGGTAANQPIAYDVASIVDANTYTYTVANTGNTASGMGTYGINYRVFDHPNMTGLVAKSDGNYAFPIRACRLKCTAWVSGKVDLMVIQGPGA